MIKDAMRKNRDNGWMITELMVFILLSGVVISLMAMSVEGMRRMNRWVLWEGNCFDAGQSQLDCLSATGKQINEELFKELWPEVKCSVNKEAGENDFQGLILVTVTTTIEKPGKKISETQKRYISLDGNDSDRK